MYYSTEQLIKAWEWARCEREIQRLIEYLPIPPGAGIENAARHESSLEAT